MEKLPALTEYTQKALEILIGSKENILAKYKFYLAGGTALAIKHSHRVSYDLDFFTKEEFEIESLAKEITSGLNISNLRTEPETIKFTLNETEISFFRYEYPLVKHTQFFESIKLASDIDIALMKITAIANRSLKKDFFDLYVIMRMNPKLDWERLFFKKYPDSNFYHYLKSLKYFQDAEKTPEPEVLGGMFNWIEIKNFFKALRFS